MFVFYFLVLLSTTFLVGEKKKKRLCVAVDGKIARLKSGRRCAPPP